MRGLGDIKAGSLQTEPDNARSRKLRQMDWRSFAKRIFDL